MRTSMRAVFFALAATGLCTNAQAGLIGLSSGSPGKVYSIDAGTGAATLLAATADTSLVGATFLGGKLYGSDVVDQSGFTVGTIDLVTGAYTVVGNQDGSSNWHGLASDEAAGLIYTIDINDGNKLKSMTAGGVVTTIGSGTGIDGRGMAYDGVNGILYATGFGSLYTVDVGLGTATLIGSLGISDGHLGLAYDDLAGVLYANDGQGHGLYSVDVATGVASLIGGNGVTDIIDGLAWQPDIDGVPEPGVLALLGASLLGFAASRRRRAA